MKKLATVGAVCCILAGTGTGQVSTFWTNYYDISKNDDQLTSCIQLDDGNIVVAGRGFFNETGAWGMTVVKVKPTGTVAWTKMFADQVDKEATCLCKLADGNFLVGGSTVTYTNGADAWLVKMTPGGDTVWTRTYGTVSDDRAMSIVQLPDGTVMVAVQANAADAAHLDTWVYKIGPDGGLLWSKAFIKGEDWNGDVNLTMLADGNILIQGPVNSGNITEENLRLVKISQAGDTLWTRTIGGKGHDIGQSLVPMKDGAVIIGGYKASLWNGNVAMMVKMDTAGTFLWQKSYGSFVSEPVYNVSLITLADGTLMMSGASLAGTGDSWLENISQNGDSLWSRLYTDASINFIMSTCQLSNGTLVTAGYSDKAGTMDLWLQCLMFDQAAKKDSLFSFKILPSADSMNYAYAALTVPSGMTVSNGGTISWTPGTDSGYTAHAAIQLMDDFGGKDTLAFNILINGGQPPASSKNGEPRRFRSSTERITAARNVSGEVRFTVPASMSLLGVYDSRGQLIEKISVKDSHAVWRSGARSGRFFAKAIGERDKTVTGFTIIR